MLNGHFEENHLKTGFNKIKHVYVHCKLTANMAWNIVSSNNWYIITWMLLQIFMYSNKVILAKITLIPSPLPS